MSETEGTDALLLEREQRSIRVEVAKDSLARTVQQLHDSLCKARLACHCEWRLALQILEVAGVEVSKRSMSENTRS